MSEQSLDERLYISNPDSWREVLTKKYLSERTLTVKTLERGVILPARPKQENNFFKCYGGVFDKDLNFIDGHNDVIDDPEEGHYVLNGAYPVEPKEILESDDTVIYGGAMIYHFGHFLTETLSRMWYVLQHPELESKIIFIEIKATPLQVLRTWVHKIFDLLGVHEDRVAIVTQPMRFRSITVPEQSLYFRDNYTKEFLIPYRAIRSRIRPSSARKIFLSRSPEVVSIVHLCNQEYFEEFYRNHGFVVVYPEKLSIADQIALISGADEIVTYIGTLSHWALFCKPGIKFTILMRVNEATDLRQTMVRQSLINEASGIDWCLVSVARSFLASAHGVGVCLIGATEHWAQFVLEHFDERIDENEAIPTAIVDDYVDRWCRFTSTEELFRIRVDTLKTMYFQIKALQLNLNEGRPALCYQVQQEQVGWLFPAIEGESVGLLKQPLGIKSFRVYFLQSFCDVQYAAYYPDSGWTAISSNGESAGDADDGKNICGLSMRLISTEFDVSYRVHVFGGGWSNWANNGGMITANYAINAVQIKVVPRDGATGDASENNDSESNDSAKGAD